jgi:hypothetical protein
VTGALTVAVKVTTPQAVGEGDAVRVIVAVAFWATRTVVEAELVEHPFAP